MKFNFKGIRFKTWLYFTLFSVAILALLWFLILIFVNPYYKSARISSIKNIVTNIDTNLVNGNQSLHTNLIRIARDQNVCFYVLNDNLEGTFFDGMGVNCLISHNNTTDQFDHKDFVEQIENSSTKTVELILKNERFDNEMIVYGVKLEKHLVDYYLIINSTIEPVDFGEIIIREINVILSVFVFLFSILMSYLISSRLSKPVLLMTKNAQSLAKGDYTVNFSRIDTYYKELDDLANTLDYATAEMAMTDELRKELIANISHDIKTPLTTIKAYSEMIMDISGEDKDKRNEHLNVIINEVNYLTNLVSDMSELSKLQSGSIVLNKEVVDIVKLVNDVRYLFVEYQDLINIKGIDVALVDVDRVKLSQVIYNFIDNAIKHYEKVGVVDVVIERTLDNMIKLSVTDYGSGISEEEQAKIWDRYYQISKNYQRAESGSGLGLSIAKGILNAHHIEYGVKSKKDEGSTFYFILSEIIINSSN